MSVGSRLFQFRYSYQRDMNDIFARVSFGASGAPTLQAGKGVVSIARVSAGRYHIVLKDTFRTLNMVKHVFINASAPASPSMFVIVNNTQAASAPSIDIVFNSAGTATDPASGELVMLQLVLCSASDAQ